MFCGLLLYFNIYTWQKKQFVTCYKFVLRVHHLTLLKKTLGILLDVGLFFSRYLALLGFYPVGGAMENAAAESRRLKSILLDMDLTSVPTGEIQTLTYLPGLKVILHTVLETFAFRLERRHDQAVANKMCRVADALASAEAAKSKVKALKRRCI